MQLFNRSRSAALWLIIVFGATFAQAQTSTDETNGSAKNTETKSAAAAAAENKDEKTVADLSAGASKSVSIENEKTFSAAPETKKAGAFKKQDDGGSNREFGFYGGSFTVHKDLKGESQKAPVVLAGLRYAWTTKNNASHRLRYYMDFNPLIVVNYRERRLVSRNPDVTVGERRTVFGVGFTPVGLQFNWRNSKKFQPFIAGGFGVAIFNRKFPDNRSALQPDKIGNFFQLMPEFGAGLEIRRSEKKSYFIGYKYHHLSNGYTAPLNVGFNTNMVYAGMYFQRGK